MSPEPNVTDTHYLILESPYGGFYGDPRKALFSLRYSM